MEEFSHALVYFNLPAYARSRGGAETTGYRKARGKPGTLQQELFSGLSGMSIANQACLTTVFDNIL